jgi:NAD(P)-dependent dehydrogenase (short-subunit alcohol dehydrogenase family)
MVSIGAASGFGLACTTRFVQEGCKVVAADINGEGLAKVYSSEDHNTVGMFELQSV